MIKVRVDLGSSQVTVLVNEVSGKLVLPDMEYSLTDLRKVIKTVNKTLKNLQAQGELDEVNF